LRSILILSSHLCLGLPVRFLPSCLRIKIPYGPLLSPIHTTCPTHLVLLDLIVRRNTILYCIKGSLHVQHVSVHIWTIIRHGTQDNKT
jgi:hypothetical protein